MATTNDKYDLLFQLKAVESVLTGNDPEDIAQILGIPLDLLNRWVQEHTLNPNGGWNISGQISATDFERVSGYYKRQIKNAERKMQVLNRFLDFLNPPYRKKFQYISAFGDSTTFGELCRIMGVPTAEFEEWVQSVQQHHQIRNIGKPNLVRQVLRMGEGPDGDFPYRAWLTRASILLYAPIAREIAIEEERKERYSKVSEARNQYQTKSASGYSVEQVWVSDVAAINTDEGLRNMTLFIDLHSRYLLGWSISENADPQSTTIAAWKMATREYLDGRKTLLLTGNDTQFAGEEFQETMAQHPYVKHHLLWNDKQQSESDSACTP